MPVPNVPIVPDLETARTQSFFTKSQIWTGPTGTGRIVPKVDDAVMDWGNRQLYRVQSVDEVTHIAYLVPENISNGALGGDSVIIGGGFSSALAQRRIFINKVRVPFTMSFDRRIWFAGSMAAYAKVFRGGDVTAGGLVVSARYDSGGNLISENIPLELINLPDQENLAMKAPIEAHCSANIANYELLNVVIYSSAGVPQGTYQFVAVISNFISSLERNNKVVRAVELLSDYMSLSDNRLLEYPVGITIQSDALRCRVLYSDGTMIELSIDDDKVQVHGLNDLISSESGRASPLMLAYRLDEDEIAEDTSLPTPDRTVSVPYRARAVTNDNDIIYNVKLFVVPVWITGTSPHWALRYFMYSLERQDIFEVTNYIEVGSSSAAFNGTLYGNMQNLTVVVNLAQVSNRYRFYRHVQPFAITLAGPGSNHTAMNYWSLRYANDIVYGQGKKATVVDDPNNASARRVRVDNGYTILQEWLNDHYYSLIPLVNTNAESTPPAPTDVRIRIGETWQRVISIADILDPIDNIQTVVTQGMDVRLEFIRQSETTILELAMGSLTAVEL